MGEKILKSKEIKQHLYAVIICGGGGTRLWPRSRNRTPKQFSHLFGRDTLFQKTFNRLRGLVYPKNILPVTVSKAYAKEIKKEAPAIPVRNIVWEPVRRNTAMACGLGAVLVRKRDPQAVVINLWADHLIKKAETFKRIEMVAAQAAFSGNHLVAIGIKPTRPHTGYGYLQAEKLVQKIEGIPIFKLAKFIEKPDLERAQKFVAKGNYYWNTGLYVWSANALLSSLRVHAPAVYRSLARIEKAWGTAREGMVLKKAYEMAPDVSIDCAVSEKAKNFLMIPAQIGWHDVGDWGVIYDLSDKNKEGNAAIKHGKGEFIGIGAKNNLVQFDDRLVALVGVENLVVIDTADALLVCAREKAQDVKKLVKHLKKTNKTQYL